MDTPKKVTFDVTRVAFSTASSVADGKIKIATAFTKFLNENLKMKIESSLLEQRQSPNVPDLGPNLASEATDSAKDGKEIWAQMQEVVEEINSEKCEVNFFTRVWARFKAMFQRGTSGDREVAKLYFQKIRNKEAFLAATINLMLWPSQKSQLNENMNILVPLLRSLKKQELENLVKPLVHGGLPLPEAVQLMREITSRMGNAPFREVFSHMEDFIINWMRKSPLPETVQLMNKIVSQMGNATRFRNLKGVLGKGLNEMIDAYALLGTDAANAIASQMLELCQKCKEQGIWALYRSQPGRQEGTSKYEHWLQAQAAANEKLSCAFKNYLLGNGSESNSMNLLKMAMIAVKPQTQWFGFSRTPVTFELSILFENASYLAEMRSSLAPNGTNAAENIAMICNLLDRPSIDEKTHKDEFINLLRENGNIMSIISKICSKPLNQYINVFMYLLKYHLYEPFNDFLVSSLRKAKDLGAITPQAAEL